MMEDFEEMLSSNGYSCAAIQVGGAKYDPSTDGRYCGWKGDSDERSRCQMVGDSSTYRKGDVF